MAKVIKLRWPSAQFFMTRVSPQFKKRRKGALGIICALFLTAANQQNLPKYAEQSTIGVGAP